MYIFASILKYVVAAFLAFGMVSPAAWAQSQTQTVDDLFAELQGADPVDADRIEDRILSEWSKSGSATMDLLLKRGRDALEAEEYEAAVDHLSALVDHAPDFAEGYNTRAIAYYRQGRHGQALEDIGRALTLNPRHFGALSGLALILHELGMNDSALEVWRVVLELNPSREDARMAIEELERQLQGTEI